MKRILLLAVFATILVALWSCRGDRIIEAPPTLSGDYEGRYLFQSGSTPPETMCVTMRFTQDEFLEVWDSPSCPAKPVSCPAKGGYELSANIRLYPKTAIDTNYKVRSCTLERHPYGSYTIDQSVPGKVTMESRTGTGDATVYRKFELEVIN